jgi:hypothetical protein
MLDKWDMSREVRFFDLLRAQKGLGRLHQSDALGIPRSRVVQMKRDGRLRTMSHGVVAAAGAPENDAFKEMLGVMLAGFGSKAGTPAAIADVSAAINHGMADGPADAIHVVTTRRMEPRSGYVFHRTSRLPHEELVMIDGIPVTDPLRTWLDMCDSSPWRAKSVFYRGVRGHLFTPASALERIEGESRQGRGGLVIARDIAENATPGAEKARSRKEEDVFNWILEAGLPLPERNVYIPSSFGYDWEIDLLYRKERRIAIEVSLHGIHGDPAVYAKDIRKHDDLRDQGYKVIVVTDETTRSGFLTRLRRELGS